MSTKERDSLLGTTLEDRFRLDDLLGEGGMGRVYEATQLSVDRKVAVKIVLEHYADDPQVRQRFLREAKLVSGFNHPNIVRLIDFGEDPTEEVLYLAMDFVRGTSLGELLSGGPLRWEVALRLVGQICNALVEAHAAGVIHRDLKPDNVLLSSSADGSVTALVLDFGVALPQEVSIRLTDTGVVCGTPAYMAPEQARSSDVDPSADLYALGVILYELLSGALPFTGDTPMSVMLKKLQDPAPSIKDASLIEVDLPDSVVSLVHDLLEREVSERPSEATAVRDRIAGILGGFDFTLRIAPDDEIERAAARWRAGSLDDIARASTTPAQQTPVPPPESADMLPGDRDESAAGPTEEAATEGASSHDSPASRDRHAVPTAVSSRRGPAFWVALATGAALLAAVLVSVVVLRQADDSVTAEARPETPSLPSTSKTIDDEETPRTTPVSDVLQLAHRAMWSSRTRGVTEANARANERKTFDANTPARPSRPGDTPNHDRRKDAQADERDPEVGSGKDEKLNETIDELTPGIE